MTNLAFFIVLLLLAICVVLIGALGVVLWWSEDEIRKTEASS
jgi:hypothetical protein